MLGQILFDGWGWVIAVACVTIGIPGVVLLVSVRRDRTSLTRHDAVLLLGMVLVLAGEGGFLAWGRHVVNTYVPRLEDDLATCGAALDKYTPTMFQGYERESCARAGVDLREVERDQREHPRELTARQRDEAERWWRRPRSPMTVWEWWSGPTPFCSTPGITCLEGGRFLLARRRWRREKHKAQVSWFKKGAPKPGDKCVLCGRVHKDDVT